MIGRIARYALLVAIISLLGFSASAQMIYNGIYWVDGKILPPANDTSVTTNGRIVVFYQTSPEAGYALDTSGTAGLSGRSGEYMLNAMEDWRMNLAPGNYKIATVKGADNYGVNPKDIVISGNGWDAKDLQLVLGEGIGMPSRRGLPDWLASQLPVQKIYFEDRIYQKKLMSDPKFETIVSDQPKINVKVTAASAGIDPATLKFTEQDVTTGVIQTYQITDSDIIRRVMNPALTLPIEIEYAYDYKQKGKTLTDGTHLFTFTAGNTVGLTDEAATVKVIGGPAQVVGRPLTYPSPLHLRSQNQVVLQYGLSKNANVDIYMFDITGTIIKTFHFTAGTPGGMAGGTANPNKVIWDLFTDQGGTIGSGIYVWNIVIDGAVKAKGKLAAAP